MLSSILTSKFRIKIMYMYLVYLDPGHGNDTPGKHSPKLEDGRILYEWEYNRKIAYRVKEILEAQGVAVRLTNSGDKDIKLSERAAIINAGMKEAQKAGLRTIAVSIHANAAGNGGWGNGTGWEVYTTKGQDQSDKLADIFAENYEKCFHERKLRTDLSDGDKDKEADFTILYMSNCPIVLTENFFYDNKKECEWMLQEDTIDRIVDLHVRSILEYIAKY